MTCRSLNTSWNENDWSPWIFIGICSSKDKSAFGDVRYHKLRSAYGWSTNGDVWNNGLGKRIQWTTTPIEHDVMQLTVNCEKRTLALLNERTREKTRDIHVDLQDKTQFPWCFYVVIANQGYRLRILSNASDDDDEHHHQPDEQPVHPHA